MRRDAPRPFGLTALMRGAVAQQQVRTGVALRIAQDEQVIDLADLEYTGHAGRVVSINDAGDGLELTTPVLPSFTGTTAGEALGGQRAVYVAADGKAYYANPDATSRMTVGITTGAAVLGAAVTIQTGGEITDPAWSWNATEVIWLASSGTLTQVVPTSGHLFQVGIPMGPTKLRIEPQLVAKLS